MADRSATGPGGPTPPPPPSSLPPPSPSPSLPLSSSSSSLPPPSLSSSLPLPSLPLPPISLGDVARVLGDDEAVRLPNPDPELEALHRAILLEEVFGVTLSDEDINVESLRDPHTVQEIIERRREGN